MRTKTAFVIAALTALGASAAYADKSIMDADASGDGLVSLDEFKSAHSARIDEHFARIDTNADGLLSEDEANEAKQERRRDHRNHGDHRHQGKRNPEEMFERLDADGNGSVSLQEIEGKRFSTDVATFQAADADGSGELDATEMQAMMKARWAEYRAVDRGKND